MSEETTIAEPKDETLQLLSLQEEDAVLDKIFDAREEKLNKLVKLCVQRLNPRTRLLVTDLTPERQRALRRAKVPESVIEKFGEDQAQPHRLG